MISARPLSRHRGFFMTREKVPLPVLGIVWLLGVLVAGAAERIPLAGEWRFALDPENKGVAGEWFKTTLPDRIPLPGTLAGNQKGPRAPESDNPKELSSEYPYEGLAWYQRTVEIPEEWRGRSVELYLERTKLTKVWLDDLFAGGQDALGVAQIYHLPELSPGSHQLTICVDGKSTPSGVSGHMITTSVQSNWNGLLGDLHLAVHDPVWIERVSVTPEVSTKSAEVRVFVGNSTDSNQSGQITLTAKPFNVPEAREGLEIRGNHPFVVPPGGSMETVPLALGADALLWDEFHPALYELEVKLETKPDSGNPSQHSLRTQFGLREFNTKAGQFTINGRTLMLRGKHDAMAFPALGHVAMDEAEWTRVLSVAKSYGINHYRFHTCCPPEAAFQAADQLGIYLQPELYNFGGVWRVEAINYNLAEAKRILSTYGNHPSFVMFSLGNEIGSGREGRARFIEELRRFDSSRLYVQGSNNEFGRPVLAEGDDYWTTARTLGDSADHAVRGSFSHADLPLGHIQRLRPGTTYDYHKAIQGVPVPVIGHETGQFQVFPDFREIPKYTGQQKPWNLETFRRRLEAAGMLDQADAFVAASGALVVQTYREEIETALRTPGFGGFQLLDLQDFPGQGTALVGILNAFMESKGLITPEEWRQFCGPVVPLARMESYTWTNAQTFTARLEVAHYGPLDFKNVALAWDLVDAQGKRVTHGELPARDYTQGHQIAGNIEIPLAKVLAPAVYRLNLRLGETAYQNQYPLWVYPDSVETETPPNVVLRQTWDQDARSLLRSGKTVLLLPNPDTIPGIEGFFTSDFWCYPMFRNICQSVKKPVAPGTLGLLIDAGHPALGGFPTEFHGDWQWWDLVAGSRAMVLDATPASFRPIVQGIDNFERNHKLGYLFEARVEQGKLLVCTMDLLRKPESPVARQLLRSLFEYARMGLDPKADLPMKTVDSLFSPANKEEGNKVDRSFSEFFEKTEGVED